MYCGGTADEVHAVVADVGSHTSKFGFSGEDTPKSTFTSMLVKEGDAFHVGDEATAIPREGCPVVNSSEFSTVSKIDALQRIYEHGLRGALRVDPAAYPLILSDSGFTMTRVRHKHAEMLFESIGVPAVYLARSCIAASFSVGRPSSIVVDCGAQSTSVCPVWEGHMLEQASFRSPVGGDVLTAQLLHAIEQPGVAVRPPYTLKVAVDDEGRRRAFPRAGVPAVHPTWRRLQQLRVAEDAKHTVCKVADSAAVAKSAAAAEPAIYELPDGTRLDLACHVRALPELLFDPSPLKFPDAMGLTPALREAVMASDVDARRELLNNVVLVGAGSLFPGLAERLTADISSQVTSSAKIRVVTPGSTERRFANWIGCSIMASLGSFQQLWISKQEYEEKGPELIGRRCG